MTKRGYHHHSSHHTRRRTSHHHKGHRGPHRKYGHNHKPYKKRKVSIARHWHGPPVRYVTWTHVHSRGGIMVGKEGV